MDRKKGQGSNTHIGQKDFKKRAIKRDAQGHFIILKGRFHQEDINVVNTYAPNIGAPKLHKENLGGLQERY